MKRKEVNVTSIGNEAFSHCSSLTGIIISNSVAFNGANPFIDCGSLINIKVSAEHPTLATIDNVPLTSINLPNSVTFIGSSAFMGDKSLTIVVDQNSYAAQYAKENGLEYTYPDAWDWLNS